jgi:hypothetical protein
MTFGLYSEKFLQYLIPFLVAGAVVGTLITAVNFVIQVPSAPTNPTQEQTLTWFTSAFPALLAIALLTFMIWWVISEITQGIGMKFTADMLEKGEASLRTSFNFSKSKLPSLLAVSVITGVLIVAGLTALVIPGIILAVVFFLIVPTIIIENKGTLGSISRSRLLVSHRWLKTLSLLLLLFVMIVIVNALVGIISIPFGQASTFVSTILTAFIQPILPIALTLHYYSMIARTLPQEPSIPTQPL